MLWAAIRFAAPPAPTFAAKAESGVAQRHGIVLHWLFSTLGGSHAHDKPFACPKT